MCSTQLNCSSQNSFPSQLLLSMGCSRHFRPELEAGSREGNGLLLCLRGGCRWHCLPTSLAHLARAAVSLLLPAPLPASLSPDTGQEPAQFCGEGPAFYRSLGWDFQPALVVSAFPRGSKLDVLPSPASHPSSWHCPADPGSPVSSHLCIRSNPMTSPSFDSLRSSPSTVNKGQFSWYAC